MAIVVSVSGAQSTGKSTLLETLKNLGFKVDEFRVARHVLNVFNKPLYEIAKEGNEVEIMKFQDAILREKLNHDTSLKKLPNDFIFVERCPADIIAYTRVWKDQFHLNSPAFNKWLEAYDEKCFEGMKNYDISIFVPSGMFSHVDDGIRAKADSQLEVSYQLRSFILKFWGHTNFDKPRFHFHSLEKVDIIERVEETLNAVNNGIEYLNFYERMYLPGLQQEAWNRID